MNQKEIDKLFGPFKEWLRVHKQEYRFGRQAWETLALLALWNEFAYDMQRIKQQVRGDGGG